MFKPVLRACRLAMFIISVATALLGPLLLSIRADFGLSLSQSGLLIAFFYAGNFFCTLVCGQVGRRMNKSKALRIGMILLACAGLLVCAAPGKISLLLLLLCLGFSATAVQITGGAIPTTLADGDMSGIMSGITAFNGLGSCAGLLLAGGLVSLGMNWRLCYLIFGIFTLLAAVYCLRVPFPILPPPVQDAIPHELQTVLRRKQFWPVFLCLLLYAGLEASITSWLSTYLSAERAFPAWRAAAMTALVWLCSCGGRLLCSRLTRRTSPHRLLCLLMPAAALSTIALPLLGEQTIWLGAAALGLSMSGIWPLAAGDLLSDTSFDGLTTLSASLLFSFLGSTLLPYGIGAVADAFGIKNAIFALGGLFFLLFAHFFFFMRRAAQKPPALSPIAESVQL